MALINEHFLGDNVDVRSQVRHESSRNSFHAVHMQNSLMVKACACVDELTGTPPISPAVEEANFSEFLICEDEHRVITKAGGRCVCSSWSNRVEGFSVEVDRCPLKHTDVMKKKSEEGIKLLPNKLQKNMILGIYSVILPPVHTCMLKMISGD